jgi:hypothetical protein
MIQISITPLTEDNNFLSVTNFVGGKQYRFGAHDPWAVTKTIYMIKKIKSCTNLNIVQT